MSAALIAALLLRNPFWPIGYEGEREEISAERYKTYTVNLKELQEAGKL